MALKKNSSNGASKNQRDILVSRRVILGAAFEQFFRNGFQGASIDLVVEHTGLTKGALFHQFKNKKQLGYAVVDEVITPMILERWLTPLSSFEDPLEGILSVIKNLIGQASEESLELGCPLNNLVQEMAPLDEGFKVRLESALKLWIDGIAHEIKRGQDQGMILKSVPAREVATFVVMSHEGFYSMIKGLGKAQTYKYLYHSLERYFDVIRAR